MISRSARKVYRTGAILSLLIFAVPIVSAFNDSRNELVTSALRMGLFAGVAGAGLTIVAMQYFLFGFDKSSDVKRVLSFLLMIVPVIGAAIYCLTTYSRQVAADTSTAATANAASA